MADESRNQNIPENPDPQEKPVSGDDITHPQEQQALPDRLPQSLVEWLARINRRYLALNQERQTTPAKDHTGCSWIGGVP